MTTTIIVAIVAVVVALLIAVPVTCKVAVDKKVRKDAEIIGTAEDKARNILDEALKAAETKKRETLLEVKEESLRTKNELERETKERRNELQRYEKRVLSKEESVDKKANAVEKRELECTAKFNELQEKEKRVNELEEKGVQELERVSGLTSEQAKEELLRSVEDDVKVDVARLYRELESRAKEEAGKKAKEYVVNAIQKCAVDHVAETTISVVQLPSDEMKGRIIGREGRNIRTLETMTGVDLIIDDTPGISITELRSKCRKYKLENDLGLVIIDYLQLMTTGQRSENRVQEISSITRNLKIMAKELNVPIIALSQLSRAVEKQGNNSSHRPQLSDLRDSGSIEQDADCVLFLYRDSYYASQNPDGAEVDADTAECIVAKNRHGETSTVPLGWDGAHTRFMDVDFKR